MKIEAYDPFLTEALLPLDIQGAGKIEVKIKTVSLEQVLKQSDFITLHVPGGKVITHKELAQMKKGVMLVNASRGGVIVEKDLLEALNSGQVARAGLDVFEHEPTPSQDIISHPGISLSPHIGAATEEAQERIGIELAELIIEKLKQ